ncbi:MAG: insulinase family protein [Candidatus Aminicenantes bacterium]|nr:insulinase family protein [Candidatus Aminicenantes bacterium]
MKKYIALFIICMIFSSLLLLAIQSPTVDYFPYPITQFTLPNGLQVILSEDYSLPTVSVTVMYHAGSINDPDGKSGLAYLIENLMFQGSRNVGRMQHINFISRIGGWFNAATHADRIVFQQTIPSNQLGLLLWLESDRMSSLQITRDKVEWVKRNQSLNTIQYRKTENPFLADSLYFDQLLFGDYSYNHPLFGLESEVRQLSVDDVVAFYSTYMRPNNAVLSICGHFELEEARELVNRFFLTVPPSEKIPEFPNIPFRQMPEAMEFTQSSLVPSPAIFLGYRLPPPFPSEHYVLTLCEYLLMKGTTSRLYKRLIKRDRVASQISGGMEIRRDRAVLKIFASINNELLRSRSRRALVSEMGRLTTSPVSTEELNKAKSLLKSDYMSRIHTTSGRSEFLAEIYLRHGTAEQARFELGNYMNILPHRLMLTANTAFSGFYVVLDVLRK